MRDRQPSERTLNVSRQSGFGLLRVLVLVWTCTLAASSATAKESTPPENDTWYALSVVQATSRMTVSHHWSREDSYRSLTIIDGIPIVTIVTRDTYYTINAMDGSGVGIARSKAAIRDDAKRGRPFATEWEDLVEAGGTMVGSQVISGSMTEAWRLSNDSGRQTVWVLSNEPRVPIRVETFRRARELTDELAYVNWIYGIPIPESFFEPWEGLKLNRLSYEQYVSASRRGPVGPAPPLYSVLIHGKKK